ncbi:ABC transporter substrate-binding protein [Pararoseomonas indoligenes]|nr:ABC transporter substrate-binding protein [Pararoseomonas indoligenes]
MHRRSLLAATSALPLARAAIAQPANARVLRYVPPADLSSLDPIWTTSVVARDHGFLVYDTLYGADATFRPQPQLAEGHTVEEDGRSVTITLRPDIRFHDNEPIRAADCVASLRRWMARSITGQKIAEVTDSLEAVDDRRLRFRLKRPFPPLIELLSLPSAPVPFIMPERVARTDPFQQITDTTGSGPYRFLRDEYRSGAQAAYARFDGYKPTNAGGTGLSAGPKVAHFERVEWKTIPDGATAAAALQQGEIDWYAQPQPELLDLLSRDRNVQLQRAELVPTIATMRFNALHPVFSDKRMRRALLPAIDQTDFIAAAVGTDPRRSVTPAGVFPPGSPMASDVALESLTGPRSTDRAKALLKEAGYSGQLVRMIGPTDILVPSALVQVGADLFRRLDINLDLQLSDWGSHTQRRANREPVEKGGWSVAFYSFPGLDFLSPATHYLARGNGTSGWFGWPTAPKLEALREDWFNAPDQNAQRAVARDIQREVMEELPFVPLGAVVNYTALRKDLRDRVVGFPIFWNIRRG